MNAQFDLTKTHETLLYMLQEIAALCDKHGIGYFLDGGTLLGAVRHKDFIPWDDDADITMTREEYERFVKVAGELPAPLLFVTPDQNNGYFHDFVPRIIHTEMPLHEETETDRAQNNHQNRLAVDIFLIDSAPDDPGKFKKMVFRQKMLYGYAMAHRYNKRLHSHGFAEKMKILVLTTIGRFQKLSTIFKKQEKLSTSYRDKGTGRYCVTNTLLKEIGLSYPKSCIAETVKLPIRGVMFSCPVGYDEILTTMYGDYMTPPPAEEQVPLHMG